MTEKLKVFTFDNYFKFCSELSILIGKLDKLPEEQPHNINQNNESRYTNLFKNIHSYIEYVSDIKKCDIVCLPFKYNPQNSQINKINNFVKQYNKKLFIFYNDDDDTLFNLDDNMILFRTSFYKSKKLSNEYALPTISPDYFTGKYIEDPLLSIGYCGHAMHNRKEIILNLYKSDIKCNFILRKGFWAPGIDKLTARNQYFGNMETNIFIFCHRGAGNFSYRFYETLMMGRIPILFNTDCVLPFDNIINYQKHCLIIEQKDYKIAPQIIIDYFNKNKDNLLNIQKNNRKLWEEYLSPLGFIKTLSKNINYY